MPADAWKQFEGAGRGENYLAALARYRREEREKAETGPDPFLAIPSKNDPGPRVKMVWASYLARAGRADEAIAAYRDVISDCEARAGMEYKELAEQARSETRRLTRRQKPLLRGR